MASDRVDTTYNGWTGRYFDTSWLNNNPLVASLTGYPYKATGTNPASTADAAKAVLGATSNDPASATQASNSSSGSVLNPFGGIGDWLNTKGKAFALGVGGVWVGSIILAIGFLILMFGTDSGRAAVKGIAKTAA